MVKTDTSNLTFSYFCSIIFFQFWCLNLWIYEQTPIFISSILFCRQVAVSSFCRSPPPASVGRAPSPDSRSRHAVHRRHHSPFTADNRGRSTAQRRGLAFPLPLYMYLCILFQFIYLSIISLISSMFPCYSCIVQRVFVFISVHLLAGCKSNYICFSMFFIQHEKICRCTTEFVDCHVKQCQQVGKTPSFVHRGTSFVN